MQYAALWVTACITLHFFAMDHEEAELLAEEEVWDAAITAGQNHDIDDEMVEDQEDRDLNLLEGRLRHEEFKKALLQSINEYYIYVDQ